MSDLRQAIEELGVIPLKRYCQITGESANTVHQRRWKGMWLVGRELRKPEGSDYWVVLAAVRDWVMKKHGADVVALAEDLVKAEVRAPASKP